MVAETHGARFTRTACRAAHNPSLVELVLASLALKKCLVRMENNAADDDNQSQATTRSNPKQEKDLDSLN